MKPMLIKVYSEVELRMSKMNYTKEFTPILIIINDFVDFYYNNQDYLKYLNYILIYGSKVGIYLLYATNNLDEKIITQNLKAQFSHIISFMINSKEVSFKYIEDDATKLLKNGDALVYTRNDNLLTRVQMANLTSEDIAL